MMNSWLLTDVIGIKEKERLASLLTELEKPGISLSIGNIFTKIFS